MIKKGFTLAEVLIVLVVVGVVASLVIPPVIHDTQDAELRTAFKSNYVTLSTATKLLVQENGGSLVNVLTNPVNSATPDDDFRDKYLQYVDYISKCNDHFTGYGTDSVGEYITSNCWSKYNYFLNRGMGTTSFTSNSQVILKNGTFLNFHLFGHVPYCNVDASLYGDGSFLVCGYIVIDVNGLKGPNQYGKDIFFMHVTRTNIVPAGTAKDWRYGLCNPKGAGNYEGIGCAAKVLKNEDY